MTISVNAFEAPKSNVLTLYHGSTALFDQIDVTQGKPYKDFGKGFYTSKVKTHAIKLAKRNQLIESKWKRENISAYLYTYSLDEEKLVNFKVKEFTEADTDWIQFVLKNRKSKGKPHNYDVVTGPTADDDTLLVINAYLDGLYGSINSNEALMSLIRNIESENLPNQIYFGTNQAASLLVKQCEVELL